MSQLPDKIAFQSFNPPIFPVWGIGCYGFAEAMELAAGDIEIGGNLRVRPNQKVVDNVHATVGSLAREWQSSDPNHVLLSFLKNSCSLVLWSKQKSKITLVPWSKQKFKIQNPKFKITLVLWS